MNDKLTLKEYGTINGHTQLQPKISLSGQEYLVAAQTATDGVALLLGLIRSNTHCLFMSESAKLTKKMRQIQLFLSIHQEDLIAHQQKKM